MEDRGNTMMGAGYRGLMDKLTRALSYVGILFLMAMMLVSVIDVGGRTFLNIPLPGSYELVQYALVGTVFFCFGHIQMVGGNISVEVLFDRLPRRGQDLVHLTTTLVSTVMFAYLSWASIQQAQDIQKSGASSGVLSIPDAPFAAMVAMGYIMLTLVLVSDLMLAVDRMRGKGEIVRTEAPQI